MATWVQSVSFEDQMMRDFFFVCRTGMCEMRNDLVLYSMNHFTLQFFYNVDQAWAGQWWWFSVFFNIALLCSRGLPESTEG